jgi:hypothetical protein
MAKHRGKSFVVPYIDQDQGFWKRLADLYGEQIKEVYFPITDEEIATGRPRQPDKYLKAFLESRILPVSVLINPVILARPVEEYTDRVLRKLEYYAENYRLTGATLTNLKLAKRIKESFPGLRLAASTLMEICSEQQLSMVGDTFDIIVPPARAIREIRILRSLRKTFQGTIRLMVNEACTPSCVFRTQHFYEMSNPGIKHPDSLCQELLEQKPWLRLTGGWILPQHLFLFRGLYDELKLSGRITLQQPGNFLRVLDSYLNEKELQPHEIGGGPASINIPVTIETAFYKYTLNCRKNCVTCKVCQDYWIYNTGKYA